jgi:hypothetical protein
MEQVKFASKSGEMGTPDVLREKSVVVVVVVVVGLILR